MMILESKFWFTANGGFSLFFFFAMGLPDPRRCQLEHFLAQNVLKSVISVINPKRGKKPLRSQCLGCKKFCPSSVAISREVDMPKNQVVRVCNCEVHHADFAQQLLSFIKWQEYWVPLEQCVAFLYPLLCVCCRGNGSGPQRLLALWQCEEMQGMRSLLLEHELWRNWRLIPSLKH